MSAKPKPATKTPSPAAISGFVTLVKLSWSELRTWWLQLGLLVGAVALPVALASTFLLDTSSDSALSAYLTLAQLIMNSALIYAILSLRAQPKLRLSISQTYYDSSVVLVRLMLVTAVLGILSLPLLLGFLIIIYGIVLPGVALGIGEQALLIILALLALVPGTVILTRSMWAIYILFDTAYGPIEALKISWRLTKKRTTAVFNRLFLAGALMFLIFILPIVGFLIAQSVLHSSVFGLVLQLLLSLIALPFATLFLTRLYQELSR